MPTPSALTERVQRMLTTAGLTAALTAMNGDGAGSSPRARETIDSTSPSMKKAHAD